VQSRNIDNYIEIPTKYQKLTMETLFVRFPHLVEDIFDLVNGKTLSCCSQINNTWKENLETYRLYLVKKIQKRLKTQKIVYSPDVASEKEGNQNSSAISSMASSIFRRIVGIPTTLEINIKVEQLRFPFLVQCLRYFKYCKPKNCEVNFRIFGIQETLFLGMFIKKGNINGNDHLVLFRNYHGIPELPSFLQCTYIYVSNFGIKSFREWLKSGAELGSNSEGIRVFVSKRLSIMY
jgi:hypothetical protein